MSLKRWMEDDAAIPSVVNDCINEYKDLDLASETRQGTAIYNAVFNLLIIEGAKDWNTFEFPEYASLDDHHIVPYSWGKEIVGDRINTVLNKTSLSAETNRIVLNDDMPAVYLRKMIETHGEENVFEVLETHLISRSAAAILMRDDFSAADYNEFIEERRKSILKKIKQLFFGSREKTTADYNEIIKGGESERVEFKSSLRWDRVEHRVNKDLELVIAKTIAAFLNSNGGTLLIGVDDERNILGIEADCITLGKKQDADELLKKIVNLIDNILGPSTHDYISIRIVPVDGVEICAVEVAAGNTPVYIKVNGQDCFFIRSGSVSQPLSVKEFNKYVSTHWR